jgi:hypothetical protein
MFWQGGFTFYAAVVIEVAQEQIGHRRQGFITREVASYLNAAGFCALILFAWDAAATRTRPGRLRRARWGAWGAMVLTLVLLAVLYGEMNGLLLADHDRQEITDPEWFRTLHHWYLWTITAQWAAALVYAYLTLSIWREEDRLVETGGVEGR